MNVSDGSQRQTSVREQTGCLVLHYSYIECSVVNNTVLRALKTFNFVAQRRNSSLGRPTAEISSSHTVTHTHTHTHRNAR